MYQAFTKEDKLKHYNLPEEYIVAASLSWGTWKGLQKILLIIDALKRKGIKYKEEVLSSEFLANGIHSYIINDKRLWFISNYGSALMSEYIHLASLFGSNINLFLGVCGGLDPIIDTNDLIVPKSSFSTDSSSWMYVRGDYAKNYYPDERLTSLLFSKLKVASNQVIMGKFITIQGMMGETKEDIEQWSAQGYQAVEMEVATVFAVSKYFNVPSAAIIQVADNLVKNETINSERYKKKKELRDVNRNLSIDTALDTIIEKLKN